MERYDKPGGERIPSGGIHEVALKWVAGPERVPGVRREGSLYMGSLAPLQGSVVPRCYGLFSGIVRGVEIACLVLEWLTSVPITDKHELNRQRMLAGISLHAVGVRHGRLLGFGHFIPVSDGTFRVVGFAEGRVHECAGTTILSRNTSGDQRPDEQCDELAVLESRFGVDAERNGDWVRCANGMYPAFDNSFFYNYTARKIVIPFPRSP
ncbi:uncharacterized protein BXZ73DRAFT_39345 [Epithele typhae]|uniref:uncharacterized protein n=1 Tax=Epithele typhae TaxID=378194 RepID=UPI00200731CE|nr:uncharacterized protein BXZ73DRAFT_39345 [Epithele typhae]KAH9944016.1 hypothetical protein BXZ73DRAFT_39345 [Epithele typhae]